VVFSVLASAYVARLVQLQILQGPEWERIARNQSAIEIEVPAPRGGIFDREGRALVLDDLRYRAYLAPKEVSDVGLAIEAASRILGLSGKEEARLRGPKSGWVPLPGRLTDAERDRLLDAIPVGVHFASVPARTYPQGGVGRLLLGAINSEGEALSGLELQFDDFLRGEPGASRTRLDAYGGRYWLPGEQISVPQSGRNVFLTIDADLQRIAENELDRALAETGSTAGDIVLLEPETGALLAVASKHQGARHVPVFTDPYEPGSTLKPFLLAALLSEGLVDLDDVIDAEGGTLKMGRRVIRDVHPNDELTVSEVVTYSSNVGAAKLSQRLRPAVQYRYLRDFGFGTPTGIEYPSESGGRLARPREWTSLSPASLAMGYEISTTSLQLAASYAALANEGLLMRPFLVREIRDETGEVVQRTEPQVLRRVVSADVASQVTEVLQSVVYEGTGTLASMASLAVAGKTGTARLATEGGYASGRYRASFVGYAPADDPQVVILTRLEDPQGPYYGGSVAAPTSHATLEAALATQGMRLDPRLLVSEPAPGSWGGDRAPADAGPFIFAVDSDPAQWSVPPVETPRAVIMPDLAGLPLRSAVARLHELGLRVELVGTGQVRGQVPAPGQDVTRGATVVLR
jgi:cell division protein FtsI (penicillin-binding protein 3)